MWSTATYPATTTINQVLYSSAANTVVGLATGNSGVLVTSGTGVPSIATDLPTAVTIGTAYIHRVGGTDVAVGDGGTGLSSWTANSFLYASATTTLASLGAATNGQIPIGSTGAAPVLAVLTWTANQVTVTNGAGTVTLATPQSIDTTATPTWGGLLVVNGTVSVPSLRGRQDTNTGLNFTGADTLSFVSGGTRRGYVLGGAFVLAADVTMTDDDWIGLGSAAGRIEVDDQATDEVNILNARVGIGTSTPSVPLDVVGAVNISTNLTTAGETIETSAVYTIPSSGDANPATYTLTPTTSMCAMLVNDPEGANVTLDEAGIPEGMIITIYNRSSGRSCTFSDTAGLTALAGSFVMDNLDVLVLRYSSYEGSWVEESRSNN